MIELKNDKDIPSIFLKDFSVFMITTNNLLIK